MNSDPKFNFALSTEAATNAADPVPLERCRVCQRWGLPPHLFSLNDVQTAADMFASPHIRYVRNALHGAADLGEYVAIVGESGAGKTTLRLDFEEYAAAKHGERLIIIKPHPREPGRATGKPLRANQIEAAFFRASFPGARIISAQTGGNDDALLLVAVDRDDLAIGANRAARRAYGLEKEGKIRPRPASDLFGREDELTGFEKAERAAMIRALARAEGNVSAAARALGVGRATLYRRMQRLGIDKKPGRLSHG